MTASELLTMVKTDLGISTTVYDERLTMLVYVSKFEIEREGATLDLDEISDCNLVIMYTAWLWRKRESGEGMPRMLRYALNQRVFSEKMNG